MVCLAPKILSEAFLEIFCIKNAFEKGAAYIFNYILLMQVPVGFTQALPLALRMINLDNEVVVQTR